MVAVFACAGVLTLLGSTAASAQQRAQPVFRDGQAQIVEAFADPDSWIREELWVEASFDSDDDGKPDRLHVGVVRPAQTETEGLQVPVIYESSPYFSGTSGQRQYLWDVRQEVGVGPPPRQNQPAIEARLRERGWSSLVSDWVPRGFAVVHSEAPGTGLSQGCPTIGGPIEAQAPKAVIDWLNGRAKGFTSPYGDEEVTAGWATGKVGMTGTSYNGTIPVAAASTGVAGLEAIIPIAPNTSYYRYYRANGLVRHPGGWLGEDIDFLYDFVNSGNPERRDYCNATIRDGEMADGMDRVSGDYNDFWAGRDLLREVDNIKAATLMAHVFNDTNVTPELAEPVHLSGWSRITLRVASSKPAANLSVYLVSLPWIEGGRNPRGGVVTRGWMDPQNHSSLTDGEPLVPGRFYDLSFNLQPDDEIIPAGQQIGLMIFSSDRDFTLWPTPGTELTVELDATSIELPVVGGAAALLRSFGQGGS